jgi:hypothetical protein
MELSPTAGLHPTSRADIQQMMQQLSTLIEAAPVDGAMAVSPAMQRSQYGGQDEPAAEGGEQGEAQLSLQEEAARIYQRWEADDALDAAQPGGGAANVSSAVALLQMQVAPSPSPPKTPRPAAAVGLCISMHASTCNPAGRPFDRGAAGAAAGLGAAVDAGGGRRAAGRAGGARGGPAPGRQ